MRVPPVVGSGLVTLMIDGSSALGTTVIALAGTLPGVPLRTASTATDALDGLMVNGGITWPAATGGLQRPELDAALGRDDAALRDRVRPRGVEVLERDPPGGSRPLDALAASTERVLRRPSTEMRSAGTTPASGSG